MSTTPKTTNIAFNAILELLLPNGDKITVTELSSIAAVLRAHDLLEQLEAMSEGVIYVTKAVDTQTTP